MTLVAPLLLIGAMPVAASVDPLILANSTITAEVTTATAGDSVTITVQLNDGTTDVNPGGTVTLTSDQVGALTVTDNGGGNYSAELVDTTAQTDTVTGTLDGEAFADVDTTVDFTPGPASADHTLITAAAGPFTVDPTPPSAGLTVQLRDQYDNNLTGSDGTVVLTPSAGNAAINSLSDVGDGTWTATVDLSDHIPTQLSVGGTLDGNAITTGDASVNFLPGALSYFTIGTVGNQTAGGAFNVDATAYDQWNNVKTDYAGGATVGASIATGLSTSPACTSCASGASAPSYGAFGTWTGGAGAASVTGYTAETGRTVTVTDGAVVNDSNTFDVAPATVAVVDFADSAVTFNGQPVTTKKGTTIYSYCAPGGSPCGSGSLPVQALARDAYGNPVDVPLTLTAPTNPGTGLLGTLTGTTGSDGQLAFTGLTVTPGTATGSLQLLVTVDSTAITATSNTVQIVDDLEACVGSTCDNLASNSNGNSQSAFAKINGTSTTSGDGPTPQTVGALDGVTLVTQFQTTSVNCTGLTTQVGRTTDVHIEAAGGVPTINYQVALVIPKATLQASGVASRNIASFNVCFGATYLGTGTAIPWKAKTSPTDVTQIDAVEDGGLWWGWLPDCTSSSKKNPQPPLSADNPCISLRTKNADQLRNALGMSKAQFAAVGFMSGDLALVYRTTTPWDAKGSIF